MATLRQVYTEWSQAGSLALGEITKTNQELWNPLDSSFGLGKTVVDLQVSKVDPTEEALHKALSEVSSPQSIQITPPLFGQDLGPRTLSKPTSTYLTSSMSKSQSAFSITVQSNTGTGQLSRLREQYLRSDAESVTLDGTVSNTSIEVFAYAYRPVDHIEMFLRFKGFDEGALDALKGFFGDAYTDELDRLELDQHRILFTSNEIWYRTGDQRFDLIPGIYFVADLELGPNLVNLVEEDSPLYLFGYLGDLDEDVPQDLLFASAPQVTLVADGLRIEDAYVMAKRKTYRTRDEDGTQEDVVEARVWVGGSVFLDEKPWALSGVLPRDHELLQLDLRVPQALYNPLFKSLSVLDPWMGGDDFWRKTLPAPLLESWGTFVIEEYGLSVSLSTGRTTSIACTLVPTGVVLKAEPTWLHLMTFRFRWTLGMPGSGDAQAFVEGDGDLSIEGPSWLLTGFEATLTCTPRLELHAVKANAAVEDAQKLVQAFELTRVQESQLQGSVDLYLQLVEDRITVAAEDSQERAIIWRKT